MTDTRTEHKRRQALSDHEAIADAQDGCVPCKLCGGKAVITDAGLGAGYYVRCENSGRFRAASGCMIEDRRLGGWAYNVMDWWNRLHSASLPAASEGDKHLVWSNEHSAWWGRDRCGYTLIIANAGRYDRAEALSIAGTRDGGWHVRKGNPDEIAIPEQDAIDQYADITRAQEAEEATRARQIGGEG